jgi:hypothetical protein
VSSYTIIDNRNECTINSTHVGPNSKKFARYIDEDKTFGKIRSCGGFDTVLFTDERLIGVEIKPDFSYGI